MLLGSAVAIIAVLRADAMPVLRDFSSDPVGLRESADDVAHQLRFADAAGVTTDYDYAPVWSCAHVTSLLVRLFRLAFQFGFQFFDARRQFR